MNFHYALVYILRVGTPCMHTIKFVVIRTCFTGDTTSITCIVLLAGLRISHHKLGVLPTQGFIWQGVLTLPSRSPERKRERTIVRSLFVVWSFYTLWLNLWA